MSDSRRNFLKPVAAIIATMLSTTMGSINQADASTAEFAYDKVVSQAYATPVENTSEPAPAVLAPSEEAGPTHLDHRSHRSHSSHSSHRSHYSGFMP